MEPLEKISEEPGYPKMSIYEEFKKRPMAIEDSLDNESRSIEEFWEKEFN